MSTARIVRAQARPLDRAPSRTRRLLAASCRAHRHSARNRRQPRRPVGQVILARDRRRPNHSLARPPRPARAGAVFRNQRDAPPSPRLFLYGLLPIVRNTATGLQDIAQPIARIGDRAGSEPAARACDKFICRSRRARFSPESKPAR